jgi:Uma2 family endonuclease
MVEVRFGLRTVDLPFTVRIPNVTEEMFDELADEDIKAELLDGVMIVHSPATPRHDDVGGFVRTLMRCFASARKIGKVLGPDSLIHLATCRKFAPDAFFLENKRVPRRLPKKQFEGAPDLALEVLSHYNWKHDLRDKRSAYREAGIREIWFLELERERVVLDRRRDKTYSSVTIKDGPVHSTVLEGFWMEAAWLWTEPLPSEMDCLKLILGE